MKSNKYFIGIDTETTNTLIDEKDALDLSQSLCYDIGWAVLNKKGKIYEKKSFVVAEIFLDKALMKDALFFEKVPTYWKEIKEGKRTLAPITKIWKAFCTDRKKWNCKVVFAHNAFFDYRALNNTLRFITGSKHRFFFPYRLEIWDTLKMARDTIGKEESYCEFCQKNNYLTKHKTPQNRLTAEILFRYLSGNNGFIESHTGLEDVEIESKIFAYCMGLNKKMRKTLFNRKRVFCQARPG